MGRVLVAMVLLLAFVGCSAGRWHVTWGGGSANRPGAQNPYLPCSLFAASNGRDYVIAGVDSESLPAEGAELSGDMSGFGTRHITNASNNHNFDVNVLYHTGGSEALMTELRRRGCAR
jgi:hypothetical protein